MSNNFHRYLGVQEAVKKGQHYLLNKCGPNGKQERNRRVQAARRTGSPTSPHDYKM